ncbi:hypothetical protein GGF42_009305, partial [Coemansia sp. RSA 2424]
RDSLTVESSPVTQASTTTASGRQHFLKKQQSSSSGFAESFGLTKLLTLGDNRYGTASTSKALPPAPLPSPPLPPPTPLISSVLSAQPTATVAPAEEKEEEKEMAVSAKQAMPPPPLADGADGARLSGSFYTPMQEFFGVSASSDPPAPGSPEMIKAKEAADAPADLVQGADSQSGFTPADSPEAPQCSVLDGSEAANGGDDGDDGDTDSDVVPLAQSRVLARLRSDSAGAAGLAIGAAPVVEEAAGLEMAAMEGSLLSAGRLRFSPDAPARVVGDDDFDADFDAGSEVDAEIDGEIALASSQQACAMGKYLYDVEEFRCQGGGTEPAVPRILQGLAVPGLADH